MFSMCWVGPIRKPCGERSNIIQNLFELSKTILFQQQRLSESNLNSFPSTKED